MAFSRILNDREVVVVANVNTQGPFEGYVLVDFHLHGDGARFRVVNDSDALAPAPVETRSGLEIREPDGRRTRAPARMIKVRLRPMEVQFLAPD